MLSRRAALRVLCSKSKITLEEANRIAAEIERGNTTSISNIHRLEERGVTVDDSQVPWAGVRQGGRLEAVLRRARGAWACCGAGRCSATLSGVGGSGSALPACCVAADG